MSVKFEDFSLEVKNAIESEAIAFLHEASGELVRQIARNIDASASNDTGQLKGSYRYDIDESSLKSTIGSPLENSIWEEYGTGERAEKGNGRKGGWYIPAERLSAKAKAKMAANKTTINGKEYYFTKGKMPKRHFRKAYTKMKPKIIRMGQERFKQL